ncbi:hypothetical protein GWK47_045456 [Chionoecetes opilio]|uniref:Uncharacterized protein n=1 Tax=Chionoecetes opilio TaxID=41210 RepID=A0A8J4YIC8_CHIOP|nr:hypothetical protein GWK47_045456 [Chionoecetes opilio]
MPFDRGHSPRHTGEVGASRARRFEANPLLSQRVLSNSGEGTITSQASTAQNDGGTRGLASPPPLMQEGRFLRSRTRARLSLRGEAKQWSDATARDVLSELSDAQLIRKYRVDRVRAKNDAVSRGKCVLQWLSVVLQWLSVVLQWLSVVLQWLSVVLQWLSVVLQWLSVVLQWLSVVLQWPSVVLQWPSVVLQWLSVVLQWLSVVLQWLSVVLQWLSVVLQWLSVVLQWLSVVLQWLSVVLQWLSVVLQWLSVVLQWLSVVLQWLSVVLQWLSVVLQWLSVALAGGAISAAGEDVIRGLLATLREDMRKEESGGEEVFVLDPLVMESQYLSYQHSAANFVVKLQGMEIIVSII